MKSGDRKQVELAQQIVELIPRLMRSFASIVRSDQENLDPAQIRLMGMLSRGPCNLSEIARQHSVSLPTVSKSVSLIEERGWVRRARSKQDRRVVLLELTPAGQRAWGSITDMLQARIQTRLTALSPAEMEQIQIGLALLEQVFCTEGTAQGGNSKHGCH